MGLITDKDVNEAKDAVDMDFPSLKKEKKFEFIDNFYREWRGAKNTKPSTSKKAEPPLTFGQVIQFLKEGIENNPKNFGRALGTLVGNIESNYKAPDKMLQRGYFEWIAGGTNVLKNKPHIRQMVYTRLDTWKNRIKLEELTTEQKKIHGMFLIMLQ